MASFTCCYCNCYTCYNIDDVHEKAELDYVYMHWVSDYNVCQSSVKNVSGGADIHAVSAWRPSSSFSLALPSTIEKSHTETKKKVKSCFVPVLVIVVVVGVNTHIVR